jgi:hypothetical protein
MVWWWWIVPGLVAVIGLAIALSGVGWMLRGRPFKGGRGVFSGGFLLAIGAVVALIGMNVQTYNRLSYERPVATVSLQRTGDNGFEATLVEIGDNGAPLGAAHTYALSGNEWQLDARVITWPSWAGVLGLDSQYELKHIWGRNVGQSEPLTAEGKHLIVERPGISLETVAGALGGLSPVQGRDFGSAVYMPMVDGAQYNICITEDALVVDPANDRARGALEQKIGQAYEPRCRPRTSGTAAAQ